MLNANKRIVSLNRRIISLKKDSGFYHLFREDIWYLKDDVCIYSFMIKSTIFFQLFSWLLDGFEWKMEETVLYALCIIQFFYNKMGLALAIGLLVILPLLVSWKCCMCRLLSDIITLLVISA